MGQVKWRVILRWMHIVLGAVLMCYIYSPFSGSQQFQVMIKFIIAPIIVISGIGIWKFPLFNKISKIKQQ